jgi:hypothetical protein
MTPIRNAECGLRIAEFKFEISFEFRIWDLFGNWDLELGILRPIRYSEIHY